MRLLFVTILAASITCIVFGHLTVGNRVYDDDWGIYKIKYSKKYGSLKEEMKRRLIWEETKALIQKHNLEAARGEHSYTLGEGPFTDLIDWREKNVVTPVKDQGECNSCWAFAPVGALESRHAIRYKRLFILSEQQVVDCTVKNAGCEPKYIQDAYSYIMGFGLESNETYPYVAKEQNCQYDETKVAVTIIGYGQFYSGDMDYILNGLYYRGPLSLAISVNSTAIQHYKSGIIDDPHCSNETDHVVLAVGYNTTDDGKDYWILKNSWGESWGDKGYFEVIRNKNMCGIESNAEYPLNF